MPSTYTEPIDVEYEIIEEGRTDMAASSDAGMNAPRDFAAEAINLVLRFLGEGNEGRALIETVILAGYAGDPDALRQHYFDNKQAIDGLVRQINTKKLIDDLILGGRGTGEISANYLGSFLAGGIAGGLVQHYILKRT